MSKHPGQILADDFLAPLGLNANQLAVGLGVNRSTISRLLAGQQPLTPAMAARLGAFFQVPARWWLLMQAEYDAAVVSGDPSLAAGVTPMEPDPDVLLTPKGVMRLAGTAEPAPAKPISLSRAEINALPQHPPQPRRHVKTVRYDNGAIALVGDET
ncbi:MAG: HigA family addiction module antitoxin [Myxococcota bacterium]